MAISRDWMVADGVRTALKAAPVRVGSGSGQGRIRSDQVRSGQVRSEFSKPRDMVVKRLGARRFESESEEEKFCRVLTGWQGRREQLGAGLWPLAGLALRVGVSKRRTFRILLIILPDGIDWKKYLVGSTRTLYAVDPSESDMGQETLRSLPMYSQYTPNVRQSYLYRSDHPLSTRTKETEESPLDGQRAVRALRQAKGAIPLSVACQMPVVGWLQQACKLAAVS
ncbi:hypothetical protein BDV11DRAFT_183241 [Aspergillus similis]